MSSPVGVFDQVLERWIQRRLLSGSEPFDCTKVLADLDPGKQAEMVGDIVVARPSGR
jgi:hypothetical protein